LPREDSKKRRFDKTTWVEHTVGDQAPRHTRFEITTRIAIPRIVYSGRKIAWRHHESINYVSTKRFSRYLKRLYHCLNL